MMNRCVALDERVHFKGNDKPMDESDEEGEDDEAEREVTEAVVVVGGGRGRGIGREEGDRFGRVGMGGFQVEDGGGDKMVETQ